jgi:alkaline phosphatase D
MIASPVAWAFGAKSGPSAGGRPRASDAWEGFPDEREEIFRFIEDHAIAGVVLISGDRHRSDAWRIPRASGMVFYDWLSARLTNSEYHLPVENENCMFSYEKKPSFGRLTFATDTAEPSVTYEILDIDGTILYEQTVTLGELSFDR